MHYLDVAIGGIPDFGAFEPIKNIHVCYTGVIIGAVMAGLFYKTKSALISYFLYFIYPLLYSLHVLFGKHESKNVVDEKVMDLKEQFTGTEITWATAMWTFGGIMSLVSGLINTVLYYINGPETTAVGEPLEPGYSELAKDIFRTIGIFLTSVMTVPNGRTFFETMEKLFKA